MLKIGITGGIGSGKSVVSRIFDILNIPVYYADAKGKEFLTQKDVIQQIENEVRNVTTQGQIDRVKLASVVFNQQDKLEKLNSIIHPLIKDDFEKWSMLRSDNPYVIMESAILFESGFSSMFDYTIHVYCPIEIRIQRVMHRDNITESAIEARINNQWDDEKISSHASHRIVNDDKTALLPQIISLNTEFCKF
jgi:dephospho-CoA kinase